MFARPHKMNLVLNISMLQLDEPEFAAIPNTPAVTQIQNAMRDTRMQTYRAASASGGFANIDLNPRRPTTTRTAIKMTKARNRYLTKGSTRMPPRSISLGAFIGFTQDGS
jgi:hypothetical protein